MDFKVNFTGPFIEDLENLVSRTAQDSPLAARRLGEFIIQTCEGLSFLPERHPRVRQRPSLRRVVVKKRFKIFYRVDIASKTVDILRCWDGFRGTDPAW